VYDLGVPLFIHANRDGAIDMVLAAHEAAAAGDLSKDRHVTLIHGQFTRQDQLDKYAAYGISPSFFSLHSFYFYDAQGQPGRGAGGIHQPASRCVRQGPQPSNHTDYTVTPSTRCSCCGRR
jgi:predicted amidohydrolase YtcJ